MRDWSVCDFDSRGKKNKKEEEQNKKNQKRREKLTVIKDGQMHFSFRCSTVPTRKKLNLKCSERCSLAATGCRWRWRYRRVAHRYRVEDVVCSRACTAAKLPRVSVLTDCNRLTGPGSDFNLNSIIRSVLVQEAYLHLKCTSASLYFSAVCFKCICRATLFTPSRPPKNTWRKSDEMREVV